MRKCRYKFCKLGGEVDREVAIKIGSAYYHKECRREIDHKKQIEDLYYNKFKLSESMTQVKSTISRYVNEYGTEYVLHVLNQDIKLNSIFGVSYYLKDSRFKQSFEREKARLIKFDIDEIKTEESAEIKYRKTKKQKLWGDMICK
ncbi:MAG TPA: hypothetical protein VFC79_09340 [Tissierellaceae bacterium]|nr:hypothetical protein [Tissierellaceae bacterium]